MEVESQPADARATAGGGVESRAPAKTRATATGHLDRPIKPLRPHPNGQWYVPLRVNGRRKNYYFGKDLAAAQRQYLEFLQAAGTAEAGGQPVARPGRVTVLELVDRFVTREEGRVRSGDIRERHWHDVRRKVGYLLEWAGDRAVADDLRDLFDFRRFLSERLSAVAFNNAVGTITAMLRWGRKHHPPLITRALDEDPAFARKNSKVVKRERRERDERHGVPEYAPAEVRALLARAELLGKPDLVAAVLLGCNAGMGAQHISDLPAAVVDLDRHRVDWVRTKTEEICQFTLWPVTAEALARAMAARPRPADPAWAGRALLRPGGRPWVETVVRERRDGTLKAVESDDYLGERFRVLERRLAVPEDAAKPEAERRGMKRPGRNIYGLRRTFAKHADDAADINARRRIMGHTFTGNDPNYVRGELAWARLKAVSDHVHRALFGCEPAELSLANLVERCGGEPALLPVSRGWTPGKKRPALSELNRRRWQDPAWRARYAEKRRQRAEARAAAAG